ncbi:Rz1-like lysis system protein LysC [Limnobaculum xujianqingii]
MLSLTSCASESPKLIVPLPIPQTLFIKCHAPDYWVKTYGDYPGYVAELLVVIEQCNNQISAIEKIERKRSK